MVMIRARQQMIPASDSAHHSLGALHAMYEGMRVLALPNKVDRAGRINDAAQSAARWNRSGRSALAAQIAGAPQLATRERALMLEIFALEGRIYDASDRVVLLLEAASNDAAAGVSSEDLNRRYTPQLAQIEVEIMQISHRQVELYAELTEAGREL
jgi:hypothetical protein